MTPPKHLWAGDWERESAAAREAEAERLRGIPPQPAKPNPPPDPPRPQPAVRRTPSAKPASERQPRGRPSRSLVSLALLAAVVAVAVLAATAVSGSSSGGPYLGVVTDPYPSGGAVISDVAGGSPADQAGLAPGDVITSVDGHAVSGQNDLTRILAQHHPGDQLSFSVQRGFLPLTVRATLGRRTADRSSP